MSSIVVAGDTSGSVTLQAPAVSGSTVLTLPAVSGTVMVNGPAFSAYLSANQTLSNNAFTKIACNTEEFDTNNNYDNATNYRFTPTVAGYYNITGGARVSATALTDFVLVIYKNGSEYKRGSGWLMTASTVQLTCANLVYLNGSTDYVEIYVYTSATSSNSALGGSQYTYFQAAMIRSA